MIRIFISHHQDARFANALRDAIHRLFPGRFEISVAPTDLALGEYWLQALVQRLRDTDLLIALCSPGISQHPWIWLEAGAQLAKSNPSGTTQTGVIAACYRGLRRNDLKPPFSALQNIHLLDAGGLASLIERLAAIAATSVPSYDVDEILRQLSTNIATGKPVDTVLHEAGLAPSAECAAHIHRLTYVPQPPLAIDGAIHMWAPPSFKPVSRDRVVIHRRHEDLPPPILEKLPDILSIPVHLGLGQNRPKCFIASITYPGSDLTADCLVLELGHSDYRRSMQISAALNVDVTGRGKTLRSFYETGDLHYLHHLPNMIVIKCVIVNSHPSHPTDQVLFVKRPSQTDFYPNHWIPGIDEQMQGTPLSSDEDGFGDPDFHPDDDFFAAAVRSLEEELHITANDVRSVELVSLFREYENYNVNALFVCRTSIVPDKLRDQLHHARDAMEARQFEWRDATLGEFVTLLVAREYRPQHTHLISGLWHPDARYRLLITCFALYGIDQTAEELAAFHP